MALHQFIEKKSNHIPIKHTFSSKNNIKSHNIMLSTGMIKQHSQGIFTWLPFGTAVLNKLEKVIKDVLNSYGMQECIVPCIQSADLWHKTNRYNAYGKETFRIIDRNNKELLLAPTAEDLITEVCKDDLYSYKQLPIILYQVNWKFRDEIRPKNGMLRTKEFKMKDGYSFDISKEEMNKTYKMICNAYYDIFNVKLGLNTILNTAENGPIGGDLSHEISIISPVGENKLEIDKKYLQDKLSFTEWYSLYAKDIDKEQTKTINDNHVLTSSTEIGHIFAFNQKYTKMLEAQVVDSNNKKQYPYMTSFGIGVSRLVQILVENYYKDDKLSLPDIINPYKIGIIYRNTENINSENHTTLYKEIYNNISPDVLVDTAKHINIATKIKNLTLIGVNQIVIVEKDYQTLDIIDTNKNTKITIPNSSQEIRKNISL